MHPAPVGTPTLLGSRCSYLCPSLPKLPVPRDSPKLPGHFPRLAVPAHEADVGWVLFCVLKGQGSWRDYTPVQAHGSALRPGPRPGCPRTVLPPDRTERAAPGCWRSYPPGALGACPSLRALKGNVLYSRRLPPHSSRRLIPTKPPRSDSRAHSWESRRRNENEQ